MCERVWAQNLSRDTSSLSSLRFGFFELLRHICLARALLTQSSLGLQPSRTLSATYIRLSRHHNGIFGIAMCRLSQPSDAEHNMYVPSMAGAHPSTPPALSRGEKLQEEKRGAQRKHKKLERFQLKK